LLGGMARDGVGGAVDLKAAESHFRAAHKGEHPQALPALLAVLRARGTKAGLAEADRLQAEFLSASLKASGRANFFAGEWTGEFIEKGKQSRFNFRFAPDGTPYWNLKTKLDTPGMEVYKDVNGTFILITKLQSVSVRPDVVHFVVRKDFDYGINRTWRNESWTFRPSFSDPSKLYVEKWYGAEKTPRFTGELTRTKD
jgi:hypothetical protein